jgi:4-diphosphocytidyl-2-C-methyl-D-erythritol kinase
MLAYAKVNLFLQIGRRLESGLHQLESLVCPISLADSVEVELVSGDLIEVICELSPELERHMQACLAPQEYRQLVASLNSESNLAGQALRKINSALGTRHGAVIRNEKRVPIFAGLGGG